jgi:putative transposase
VSEAHRLRGLEDENHLLKELVADLSLDKEMLKAVIVKTDCARRPKDRCELAAGAVPDS